MMNSNFAEQIVKQWYAKAQIDYADQYMRLYVAYNAWYRTVTHTNFDREAIARLKRRVGIWIDYVNGAALVGLRPLMQRLIVLTHGDAVQASKGKWNGQIQSEDDWHSLIELWYQIRCSLFHGDERTHNDQQFSELVHIAYESLNLFMTEILRRMDDSLSTDETLLLRDIEAISSVNEFEYLKKMRMYLRKKYLNATDVWNVDVQWRENEG